MADDKIEMCIPKILAGGYCCICRNPITTIDDVFQPSCCYLTMCECCALEICEPPDDDDEWICKDCQNSHDRACSMVKIQSYSAYWKEDPFPEDHCDPSKETVLLKEQ